MLYNLKRKRNLKHNKDKRRQYNAPQPHLSIRQEYTHALTPRGNLELSLHLLACLREPTGNPHIYGENLKHNKENNETGSRKTEHFGV